MRPVYIGESIIKSKPMVNYPGQVKAEADNAVAGVFTLSRLMGNIGGSTFSSLFWSTVHRYELTLLATRYTAASGTHTEMGGFTSGMNLSKLEFSGALLLAQLVISVISTMQLEEALVYCWSDSMIVLSWLKKESTELENYAAWSWGHVK